MQVDNCLVREAQILMTGANNHDTDQLIAMYRGAAKDGPLPAFEHFERALKEHVVKLRAHRARMRTRMRA